MASMVETAMRNYTIHDSPQAIFRTTKEEIFCESHVENLLTTLLSSTHELNYESVSRFGVRSHVKILSCYDTIVVVTTYDTCRKFVDWTLAKMFQIKIPLSSKCLFRPSQPLSCGHVMSAFPRTLPPPPPDVNVSIVIRLAALAIV